MVVHLRGEIGTTVCGRTGALLSITENESGATCQTCLRRIERRRHPPEPDVTKPAEPATAPVLSNSARSFYSNYSKIAGVTFANSDGPWRQQIVARCRVGEQLSLVREPDNPVSSSAIAIFRRTGEQLGYRGPHFEPRLGRGVRRWVHHSRHNCRPYGRRRQEPRGKHFPRSLSARNGTSASSRDRGR